MNGPVENLIFELRSILEPISLDVMFPVRQPLEIELGSGDGSFLLAWAARHPERNFIGVERLLGRIQKLDRKGRRGGLRNLRGLRIESAYFVQYLLPAHSAQALHVYFPDPWPKRKHRRHRLINEAFPALATRALVPGGAVYLRTDDRDYFGQMQEVFGAAPGWTRLDTPAELREIHTDFEADFLARGIPGFYAAYRAPSQ